jgi:plastocyanin
MIRSLVILVLGIIVFGVGLQQVLQVRSQAQGQTPPGTPQPSPSTSVRARTRTPAPTRVVHIVVEGLNFGFSPPAITVPLGAHVIWASRTASPHTITSVSPHLFDVSIPGRGRVELTFIRPGTFQYYCALHPYMLGVIHVRG